MLVENKIEQNNSLQNIPLQDMYFSWDQTVYPSVETYSNLYQNMYQVASHFTNQGLQPVVQNQQTEGVLGTIKGKFKSIAGKIVSNN